MHIPGHIAFAWASTRRWAGLRGPGSYRKHVLAPVILGALLPDLIDKPIYLAQLSIYGRTLGHSLLFFGLLCAIAALAQQRKRGEARIALSWLAAGTGTHLLLDLIEGLLEGILHGPYIFTSWWLWPYLTPDTLKVKPAMAPLAPRAHYTGWLEAAFVLIVIVTSVILWRRRQARAGEENRSSPRE